LSRYQSTTPHAETKKPPEGGFFDLKLKITSSLQQLEQLEQQLEQQEQQQELQQQELVQEQQLLLFYRKQPKPKPTEKRSATNFS
jgi:hypothetical protein